MVKSTRTKIYNSVYAYAARWLQQDTWALWIVASVGIVLAALLAFLGTYARPIADDYVWIYQAHSMGIPQYMHQQLWYTYGRYGNALALALLGKVFNTASVMVAPLILILILIASAYYAATAFGIKKVRALAVALIATSLLLTCVPSMFDSIYWMNSSTLYPLAIAGSMLVAGATIRIWGADKIVLWKLVITLCLAVMVGGLNEIAPIINLVVIAAVCIAWSGKQYGLRLYAIGAMVATQLFALAVLKWAPGSLHRQSLAHPGESSLLHIAKQSAHAMGGFITSLSFWYAVLIVAASATIALTLYNYGAVKALSKDLWYKISALLVLSAALFVTPVFITLYAHSIRDNGQPPYRVQTYLVAGMILAFTTIIWVACVLLRLRSNVLKNTVLLLALGVALVLSIGRTGELGLALTTRSFLYDQRTTMANLQIKSGKTTLLLPQVLFYGKTDSADLPLTDYSYDVSAWVSWGVARYLGVEWVKTDNSRSLEQCPATHNWYINHEYCASVYKSVVR